MHSVKVEEIKIGEAIVDAVLHLSRDDYGSYEVDLVEILIATDELTGEDIDLSDALNRAELEVALVEKFDEDLNFYISVSERVDNGN